MLYTLVIQQAHKFRYKQIHLQQRFDQYFKLISKLDEAFAKALEEDISLFPPTINLGEFAEYINMYVPAGFVYDQLGQDLTYLTE